jgi:hypothetical protein
MRTYRIVFHDVSLRFICACATASFFILVDIYMNIVVRHIYVFEWFCILDTMFDVPILYFAKGHDCLTNITPLSGYRELNVILRKGDDYFFVLTVAGEGQNPTYEKVYHTRIDAHSTPYLCPYSFSA